ncbi:MAG: tRNA (adenosine(37)-N6)-threonylcarbamoyltransferase complex ATPase subunit type 1 TsaE [Candidatus Omnitrophica bacterium]|nr:tRNA (adenosine(37)-N6)-threonylcarbamoyltransferase complex ATPase subunit type 1 TsaE [Candidatus Omnitrophota bacterium]
MISRSTVQTRRLGAMLARRLKPCDVVALTGEIGAGKTTFVQGIAEGLGVAAGSVASPSFVLVREYQGRIPLFHADLFRLDRLPEAQRVGLEEYYDGGGVTVIEWANRVPEILPEEYLEIRFEMIDPKSRRLNWVPRGPRYEARFPRAGYKTSRGRAGRSCQPGKAGGGGVS